MTKTLKIAAPLLAAAAMIAAAPLAADQPMTVTGQQLYQERVAIGDLDLTKWSHRNALKRRVQRASERVCIAAEGPFDANQSGFMDGASCTEATYDHTRPQIAAAIDRARSGQALAANLTVRLVTRAR